MFVYLIRCFCIVRAAKQASVVYFNGLTTSCIFRGFNNDSKVSPASFLASYIKQYY